MDRPLVAACWSQQRRAFRASAAHTPPQIVNRGKLLRRQ